MSKLTELLEGVEVKWKALGEVAGVFDGTHQTPKYVEDGVPFVSVQNIKNLYSTEKYISFEDFEKYKYKPQEGDVFMTRIGDIGTCAIVRDNKPLAYYVTLTLIRVNQACILPKFLKYIIESNIGQEELYKRTLVHATPIKINLGEIGKIIIPIPPLSVQTEIVRILDTFTERTDTLINELTTELEARKKQYNYYREELLSFEEGEVEWKALENLAENLDSMRKPVTSSLREAGDIPYYGASGIVDYVKDYIFDGDFLLISEDGANLVARSTPIAFTISGKSWVNNHAHVLKFNTYSDRRFVEYYLNSIDLTPYISGAAQPKLNQKNLNSIKIPNPSPEEKERIVAILDKLDSLTTSISEALPKEITLRKKQYEYYRDLLLTFPKDNLNP